MHKPRCGANWNKVNEDNSPRNKTSDTFGAVAKRLECDDDKARSETKLGKLAKTKINSAKDK